MPFFNERVGRRDALFRLGVGAALVVTGEGIRQITSHEIERPIDQAFAKISQTPEIPRVGETQEQAQTRANLDHQDMANDMKKAAYQRNSGVFGLANLFQILGSIQLAHETLANLPWKRIAGSVHSRRKFLLKSLQLGSASAVGISVIDQFGAQAELQEKMLDDKNFDHIDKYWKRTFRNMGGAIAGGFGLRAAHLLNSKA